MRARPRFSRLPSSPKSWATPRHSSTAWSGRMKTSMSDAMRSPSERPPPTSTLKPTVPSARSAGHRPMSLISTRAQSSVQPVTAILNFRGRLAYSRLPVKKAEIAWATGQRVDDLVGVDPRHRARADVAGRVAAGLDRGQPDLPEALPDPRDVGDPDPVQLDVLARGEVGVAVAEDRAVVGPLGEGVGRHADLAAPGRRVMIAAGHLDPHHEGVAALALRVHADPLQPLHLAGHRVDGRRRPAWSRCRSPPAPPRRGGAASFSCSTGLSSPMLR